MNQFEIEQTTDFEQLYDLEDPSPYFAHLADCDYRMPMHVVDWLRNEQTSPSSDRRQARPLKVLDLACGYGFNGLLLCHDLELADVYAHYGSRTWSPADQRSFWDADAAFFARVRRRTGSFEVAGLDIASTAVEYSLATGLIDLGFTDDLTAGPASRRLAGYLHGVDLVVESGAIGAVYVECFSGILDAVDEERPPDDRPWFLYCPRPDVDRRPVEALWRRRGYRSDVCTPPLRYRRPVGRLEAATVIANTVAAGNDPVTAIVDGYLAVEIHLARPIGHAIV